MRLAIFVLGLGLAGCGVHKSVAPTYSLEGNSPYDKYRQERELALSTGAPAPATIPITLPVNAPTPDEISGPSLMQIIAARYRAQPAQARAAGADIPADDLPVVTTGPYPGTTPVLVRYAFAARHPVGQAVWPRQNVSQANPARFCADYPDAARAQTAFLAAGGPDKDPLGVDPDGDGFVCGWDPAPYRVEQL